MSDYAADMIAESVALPLFIHENPIEKFLSLNVVDNAFAEREQVYSPFDNEALSRAIELRRVDN